MTGVSTGSAAAGEPTDMGARILLLYSTTDGHTRRICEGLRRALESDGHTVSLVNVETDPPADLSPFDKIVIGARIRYGRHSARVADFIMGHKRELEEKPSAFFSVNIVARKPNKNRPDTNPYLGKFLRQVRWQPAETAVFAGRLDYPSYRYWDRQIIRFIMWLTKGPTDPRTVVEFTDWQQVRSFAARVSHM